MLTQEGMVNKLEQLEKEVWYIAKTKIIELENRIKELESASSTK